MYMEKSITLIDECALQLVTDNDSVWFSYFESGWLPGTADNRVFTWMAYEMRRKLNVKIQQSEIQQSEIRKLLFSQSVMGWQLSNGLSSRKPPTIRLVVDEIYSNDCFQNSQNWIALAINA